MLKSLTLHNFRCFEHHEILFAPLCLLVGRNNAGKSTVVDALRLISLATARYRSSNYSDVPNWLDAPARERGFSPSLRGFPLNLETVFHGYSDPPAMIMAKFESGESIKIYIGPSSALHAVIINRDGRPASTRSVAQHLDVPQLAILPQITPLLREEPVRDEEYVRRSMSSNLGSLHFRNELKLNPPLFNQFKEFASDSWPHLQVRDIQIRGSEPADSMIDLYVRDGQFVAEVGAMGHGLQMWLQVIWFLTRTPDNSPVILDEPDVYMHPDLQRRLIRLVQRRFSQTIIATHSVEMMSEVEPSQVLIIDKSRPISEAANSLPAVQRIVDTIGSVHNLQLTRIWSSRKLLFVEGNDLSFLKIFQNLIFPESNEPIDSIPNMGIGGWGGWGHAVTSSLLLKNAGGNDIRVYCILDRDYYPKSLIRERLESAHAHDVELHIWNRKEIENYLLVPAAILRALTSSTRKALPTNDEVREQLRIIADNLKDDCVDKILQQLLEKRITASVTEASSGLPDLLYHFIS